jgi:hypothetical protein
MSVGLIVGKNVGKNVDVGIGVGSKVGRGDGIVGVRPTTLGAKLGPDVGVRLGSMVGHDEGTGVGTIPEVGGEVGFRDDSRSSWKRPAGHSRHVPASS